MIYYVMDNLYFLSHSITPASQPSASPFSHFSVFIFHHLKMVFIEIYFVITFSYPSSTLAFCLLLAMVVNGFFSSAKVFVWLALAANKNVTEMMLIFSLHAQTLSMSKSSLGVLRFRPIQIYWPNYFCQFSPCSDCKRAGGEEIYQFIHIQMNKYFYANRRP